MKTQLFQKVEFLLALLEDSLESKTPRHLEKLLKEMKVLAQNIGGTVLEHFLDMEREVKHYRKNPQHLPALKLRVLNLRNDFWQL